MDKDEYGEIINGKDTFRGIAMHLHFHGSALIGWTDEHGTHYDILFTNGAEVQGSQIQRGIKGSDLFVSVMSVGSFGFEINDSDTSAGYYNEKLTHGSIHHLTGVTGDKFAELINGVRKELFKLI